MSFEYRATQIIELLFTVLASVPLSIRLVRMKTMFVDLTGATPGTAYPVWPTQFTNDRKAFCIIDQLLNVYHVPILSEAFHLLETN